MNWLPSPLWFTVIGGLCAAGAVGCFFVPLIGSKVGIDLGLIAGVFFLLAACAHTYTARGEATVQAKFDAFKTEQAQLAASIASQQAAALAKAKADSDAAVATEKARSDALTVEVNGLKHSVVSVSGALSRVLHDASANPAGGNVGPKPGGQNASVTVPASATDSSVPACYDESALGSYFAAARAAYNSARNAWSACVADFTAIRAPTLRGASP